MSSPGGAVARRVQRTLVAVRHRLRHAPWTQQLTIEFAGAVRVIKERWPHRVFLGLLDLLDHDLRNVPGDFGTRDAGLRGGHSDRPHCRVSSAALHRAGRRAQGAQGGRKPG